MEERLSSKIENLEKFIAEKFDARLDFSKRLIEVERNIHFQSQYSRRECIEIVGIPSDVPQNDLEKKVIDVFSVAGVAVSSRDFQAVHRINNKSNVVIAKLSNRKDALAILRNKKKLRNLTDEGRAELNVSEE